MFSKMQKKKTKKIKKFMLYTKKKKKKKKKHVEYLHLTKALCKFERVISFTSLS